MHRQCGVWEGDVGSVGCGSVGCEGWGWEGMCMGSVGCGRGMWAVWGVGVWGVRGGGGRGMWEYGSVGWEGNEEAFKGICSEQRIICTCARTCVQGTFVHVCVRGCGSVCVWCECVDVCEHVVAWTYMRVSVRAMGAVLYLYIAWYTEQDGG